MTESKLYNNYRLPVKLSVSAAKIRKARPHGPRLSLFYGYVYRGGLMVSALDSGASAPGSSPGWGHCVVFLGKTLDSHSASLHPGVLSTGEFNAGGNPAMD